MYVFIGGNIKLESNLIVEFPQLRHNILYVTIN